ncbi:unnamed protein product [Leuciscus chuanchicus]
MPPDLSRKCLLSFSGCFLSLPSSKTGAVTDRAPLKHLIKELRAVQAQKTALYLLWTKCKSQAKLLSDAVVQSVKGNGRGVEGEREESSVLTASLQTHSRDTLTRGQHIQTRPSRAS